MGFLGSLAKIGGAIGGFVLGGPVGAVTGFKAASSVVTPPKLPAPPPAYIAPPAPPPVFAPEPPPRYPPPPPPTQPPPGFLTFPRESQFKTGAAVDAARGGIGGGPVNTYAPPMLRYSPPVAAPSTVAQPQKKIKIASPKKAKKRAAKKKKAAKLKFGSPAWRKKYAKKKK